MLEFLPQCCDAYQYLELGGYCATEGRCYHDLRPMGSQLWFAWPQWLGLPVEAVIVAAWVLLGLSSLISVVAMRHWFAQAGRAPTVPWVVFMLLLSVVAHAVFFWPVMQVSVVDAPAGLMALMGLWLLILARSNRHAWWLLGMSGLLLGAAASTRIFYLYPVLVMLAVYVLLWGIYSRQWKTLGLLLVLLPIGLQYMATYERYQQWGFIAPDTSDKWSDAHLIDSSAGYDTVLPWVPYRWGARCGEDDGLLGAWERRDAVDAACIFWGRINFYWGSYAAKLYPYFGTLNLLDMSFIEDVGNPNGWGVTGLRWEQNVIEAPDILHEKTADRLVATSTPYESDRVVYGWWPAKQGVLHTFSIWLWADHEDDLDLVFYQYPSDVEVARKTVRVTREPARFFITAAPVEEGMFGVRIGSMLSHPVSFGSRDDAALYVWGAKLEASAVMNEYYAPIVPEGIRAWSWWLLAISGVAMLMALMTCWRLRHGAGITTVTAAFFTLLCIGLALFVVPEQRFMILPNVMIAVLASWAITSRKAAS